MEFFNIIDEACNSVNMSFNEDKYNKFIDYKNLLQEWNEKINLTAITEDEAIIKKHFIDCIKAFNFEGFKTAKSVIDVGTGAGFPGLPLAIMRDDVNVLLLDSLNKRINFLNEVTNKLGLKNITTLHGRAEEVSRKKEYREGFDIATSRAVANMSVLSELCLPYVKVGGYFIALKGPSIDEELNEGRNAIGTLGGKLEDIVKVNIEGTDLNHNLVIVKKIKNTPEVYPRKASSISKKPIK